MQPLVIRWLDSQSLTWVREGCTPSYYRMDFVAGRFAERTSHKRPPLLEGFAVELKLTNVARVLAQAIHNSEFVDWSYVAMPAVRIEKFRDFTMMQFERNGIGLLAVNSDVKVIMAARRGKNGTHEMVAQNLWRRRNQYGRTQELNRAERDVFAQQIMIETCPFCGTPYSERSWKCDRLLCGLAVVKIERRDNLLSYL